jgi:hypothetical protein
LYFAHGRIVPCLKSFCEWVGGEEMNVDC